MGWSIPGELLTSPAMALLWPMLLLLLLLLLWLLLLLLSLPLYSTNLVAASMSSSSSSSLSLLLLRASFALGVVVVSGRAVGDELRGVGLGGFPDRAYTVLPVKLSTMNTTPGRKATNDRHNKESQRKNKQEK